jgi:hypothetical protein
MVGRPEASELVGLAGLGLGFVVFTFGALGYARGSQALSTVAVVVAGGLVGFLAAGYLVVYYHVVRIAGG